MTIRGREASSSTSGSETSSDRRSETSLHGSELSLEENQDDSVFSSNLLDQTSDQSPADYDLLANLSHIEEMVVDRENERTTDQVGGCVKIKIKIKSNNVLLLQGTIEDEGLLQQRSIFQQLAFTEQQPAANSEEDQPRNVNCTREERVSSEKSCR